MTREKSLHSFDLTVDFSHSFKIARAPTKIIDVIEFDLKNNFALTTI